jgi:hypothetical protein
MRALLLLLVALPAYAQGVTTLGSAQQLRADFERAADRPRILALVSPT